MEWEGIDEEKVEIELKAKQLEYQIKTNTLQLVSPVREQESESFARQANEAEVLKQMEQIKEIVGFAKSIGIELVAS